MAAVAAWSFIFTSFPLSAEVVYEDNFNATDINVGTALHGRTTTTGGGTWHANDILTVSGSGTGVGTTSRGGAFLPFIPEIGQIYTLSAVVDIPASQFIGIGFADTRTTLPGVTDAGGRINSAGETFLILDGGGNWQTKVDTATLVASGSSAAFAVDGTHTLTLVLNTMGSDGNTYGYKCLVDGNLLYSGTHTDLSTLRYVMLGNHAGVTGGLYDKFSFTQESFVPWNPSPADHTTTVSQNAVFLWDTALDPANPAVTNPHVVSHTLRYIAYDLNALVPATPDFQNAAAVTVQVAASANPRSPASGDIAFGKNQRIYWQVLHVLDTAGTIAGPVWSFDTPRTGQMDIMQYWAPVVYQDFNTGTDFGRQMYGAKDAVVPFNFDGDWTAANNWANSIYQVNQQGSGAPLNGKVYASLIESDGFYFIKYGFYHAGQDSGDAFGTNARHQNDWEVVVLAVQKNGTEYGSLKGMVTQAHTGVNNHTAAQLLYSQQRPIIYIQPNGLLSGHGIEAYSNQSPGSDGVVYNPDAYSENVMSAQTGGTWATAPKYRYKIVSLAEAWGLRNSTGTGNLFSTYKAFNYDPTGEPNGAYMTWDKDYFYDPIVYFKTNFTGLSAALANDRYVFNPYANSVATVTGPANAYGVFTGSEWVPAVVGSASVESWPYRSGCTHYHSSTVSGAVSMNCRDASGDFELSTRVHSIQAISGHRAGLEVRENLSSGSPYVSLSVTADQRVHVTYRSSQGGSVVTGPDGPVPTNDRPVWIKLKRTAGAFSASYSYAPEPSYTQLLEATIPMSTLVKCGISATSNSKTWASSSFSDLTVGGPPAVVAPVSLGLNRTGTTSWQILYSGIAGTQYILQESTTLTNDWIDVGNSATCVPGINIFQRSTSAPKVFWRVRTYP